MGSILFMVSFLFGLSWRVWGGTVRTFALTLAVALGYSGLAAYQYEAARYGLVPGSIRS